MGNNGGALKEMLPAFKWGFGGIIGSGNQWFSWVHIEDVINVFKFLINNKGQRGIFNLTSPNPVSNLKLTRAIGESLNRPTIFTMNFNIKYLDLKKCNSFWRNIFCS